MTFVGRKEVMDMTFLNIQRLTVNIEKEVNIPICIESRQKKESQTHVQK